MVTISQSNFENLPKTVLEQPCVQAVRSSSLKPELKLEAYKFIRRNILSDCKRVPPRCLKAHLIKKAKKVAIRQVSKVRKLFRAKPGFKGYYLDSGKLKHI